MEVPNMINKIHKPVIAAVYTGLSCEVYPAVLSTVTSDARFLTSAILPLNADVDLRMALYSALIGEVKQ